jgi:hypothetical protein
VKRIGLDGSEETVAQFNGLHRARTFGPWYGMTPDGACIALKDVGNEEIYSVSLTEE